MRWNMDIIEALLTREQRDAIKRVDAEHYMKEDVRRPCDVCLVLSALKTTLDELDAMGAGE